MRCSCSASATSRSCTGPTKSGGGSCCPGAGNRGSGLEIGKSSYPLLALIHVPMTIPAPDPRSSGRRALANPESRIPNPGHMQLTLERPDYDFFRSEEHTSELQSLMRISYAVFCLKKKKKTTIN